jgi:hypothetical protein
VVISLPTIVQSLGVGRILGVRLPGSAGLDGHHTPAIVCGRLAVLTGFRGDFYDALAARRNELFELTDAVLCTDGAVKTLVELALAPEHQRGHGAV